MESTCIVPEEGACLRIQPDSSSAPGNQAMREEAWRNETLVNYRLADGEKKYLDGGEVGCVISTNSSVGFDVTFLRYLHRLHFDGYVSFAAVEKSRASPSGHPKGNRPQASLADASPPLRESTEFRRIEYDVRNIAVGDEMEAGALLAYTAHLMQNAYPPRSASSVRAVVADGDAKVSPKRGTGEKPPRPVGAPVERKDGSEIGHKPRWAGWFFFIRPKSGIILNASPTYRTGNNAIVLNETGRVVGRYLYVRCPIYDRSCEILEDVATRE